VDVLSDCTIANGVNDDDSSPTDSTASKIESPSPVEVKTELESRPDSPTPSRKRSLTGSDVVDPAPARKRRTSSDATTGEQEWRELCQNAKDIFCDSLPGLEEAAVMFGYAAQ
jgi:hypothetical protein